MQQGVQTDATCNIQQCWELLANNVASVCTGLKKLCALLVCEAEHSTNQLSIIVIWGHGSQMNMQDFLTLIENL